MTPKAGTKASRFIATTHKAIAEIEAEGWDLCAGAGDPLLWHRHLSALEASGVAAPESGFTPRHVVLRDREGQIVGAAPAYLKTHSRGELGVDLGLSMAHQRQCGPYYPKLQVELPMIPFAGPRLLLRPEIDRAEGMATLAAALIEEASVSGASSVQVAQIATEADALALAAQGFVLAQSNTYLWQAGAVRTFDDILTRMASRARTEIRRERRRVAEAGLTFRHLRGQALTPDLAKRFYPLYRENFDRHGSEIWLPETYFAEVLRRMPEAIEISLALQGDRWAGALFSVAGDGGGQCQYWGLAAPIRFLHFELVIYRGIERALVTGLERLDFGGTGGHKPGRGLDPAPIWTAFWFRDPEFAAISAAAARRKTSAAQTERVQMQARSPFRSTAAGGLSTLNRG